LFADHLNTVLNRTVTRMRLVPLVRGDSLMLGFRQAGSATVATLSSTFGPLELYLGQVCRATQAAPGEYQLATVQYGYSIGTPGSEPTVRWEYRRTRQQPDATWCRHHIQGPIDIPMGSGSLRLNNVHVPTGWVTVEEVLRFCLAELSVPPLSEDWDRVLEASYKQFKTEFAPLGEA
jgi:hypothetical protein